MEVDSQAVTVGGRRYTWAGLEDMAGEELGTTRWLEMSQERINQFAAVTGDHQWIHVDPARAAVGPFRTTIAHGYLTLALASVFVEELLRVDEAPMAVNYGANRVRFPAPVPSGSRVRASGTVLGVAAVPGGLLVEVRLTMEAEHQTKPVCVVDALTLFPQRSGPGGGDGCDD